MKELYRFSGLNLGKPAFCAIFNATKESLVRQIQTFYNLLKDLGVNVFKFGNVLFSHWQRCFLRVIGQALSRLLILYAAIRSASKRL
ncbi:MAG: hypothetical protein ACQEXV_13385 [Bacillota bacterium]